LSCGFNRLKTSWRLRRKDFVDELGINQRTVSRALARLLKTGRIYRSDPKMGYWYYSLYPSAKALVHAFQTGTPVAHTVTPVSQGRDTGGTHCDTCVTGEGHRWHTGHHELSRVNTLRAGRGTEHISSILQRIRPG
jgi:DNA-binding IclR family transcriptional regulator